MKSYARVLKGRRIKNFKQTKISSKKSNKRSFEELIKTSILSNLKVRSSVQNLKQENKQDNFSTDGQMLIAISLTRWENKK